VPKHNITTVDREKVIDKVNESVLVEEISKAEFFSVLEEHGYGHDELKEIFEGKRLSSTEQYRFNNTLRSIKKETHISITDCIIYLEESFIKFKRILSVFDDETKSILKRELSNKFRIKIDENNLGEILG